VVSDLFVVGALGAMTAVPAICRYLKWRDWMKLNRHVFDRTGDPSVFGKTAPAAKAFDRPSVTDTIKMLPPVVRGRGGETQQPEQPPTVA
jgi:hypothetical protein